MPSEHSKAAPAPPRSFPNSMLSEIYEQPHAIRECIRRNIQDESIFADALQPIDSAIFAFKKIIIARCV